MMSSTIKISFETQSPSSLPSLTILRYSGLLLLENVQSNITNINLAIVLTLLVQFIGLVLEKLEK